MWAQGCSEGWQAYRQHPYPPVRGSWQIISAINVRNLTKEDLLRMRKKTQEEKKSREEQKQSYSTLKIRKIIDKRKPARKYYAIKHPTDLVITDSWEIAKNIIDALNATDLSCRYKGFKTMAEAIDYLRG